MGRCFEVLKVGVNCEGYVDPDSREGRSILTLGKRQEHEFAGISEKKIQ